MTKEEKTIKELRQQIQQLKQQGNEFFDAILNRQTIGLYIYPKDKLKTGWALDDLYERGAAAKTLGYDLVIRIDINGVHIDYAKKLPTSRPWAF